MVIGGDSLKNFSSWHKPQELAEKFGFIIYPRCNEDCDFAALSAVIGTEAAEKMQKNVINAPFFEISSTILRKKLANCENTANFISETVLNYIREKKLY
jgi:nicotinate-nucleotide adenylyltransferase